MKKQHVTIMMVCFSGFGFVAAKIGWSYIAQQLHVVSTAVPIVFALSALQALLQIGAGSSVGPRY